MRFANERGIIFYYGKETKCGKFIKKLNEIMAKKPNVKNSSKNSMKSATSFSFIIIPICLQIKN